jgi:hypothetical protein
LTTLLVAPSRWFDEGLEAARHIADPRSIYAIRNNQGLAWLFLDDLEQSERAFHDALAICRDAAGEDIVDETLLGLAAVAARQGQLHRAAQLVGAAKANEVTAVARVEQAVETRLQAEILTPARDQYGSENWDRAHARYASLTAPEAIDLALARGKFATAAAAPTAHSPT